jgi:plastocyanin
MPVRRLTQSRLARTGAAAAILLVGVVFWATGGSAADKSIRTMGTEDVHINSKIFSDLRFSPGDNTVKSGESITLVHGDQTTEPHTLTIVNADELPADVESVFACGEPGTICDEVFNTVAPQIVDDTKPQFINVSGGAGLDGRLDTIFLPAGSITVPVTAPSGTTLSFMCVIHPWMQGTIRVN